MGVEHPPFYVPPDDLSLWVKEDEHDYEVWKGKAGKSKSTIKEDFRQHIINLNTEFNMEDVFENLEIGLEAFEKLIVYIDKFSN